MLVLSNDLVLSKSILIFNGTHFPFCTRFPGTFFQKLENVSRCWLKVIYITGIVFQKGYCHFEGMDLCSKKSHNETWNFIPNGEKFQEVCLSQTQLRFYEFGIGNTKRKLTIF